MSDKTNKQEPISIEIQPHYTSGTIIAPNFDDTVILDNSENDIYPRAGFINSYVDCRGEWDEYFLKIAEVVSSRSSCSRRKVGCVITKDKHILTTGYNGTPRGLINCNEGGCPRCAGNAPSGAALDECLCSHAEENAIVQAAYHGVSICGGTLYCTITPCVGCTKMIINAGITRVVCKEWYKKPKMLTEDTVFTMLMRAHIKFVFPDFFHDKEN